MPKIYYRVRKIKILLITLFSVIIVIPNSVVGWDYTTHRWVAEEGMTEIIKFMPSLEGRESKVISYSVAPDEWKATKDDEPPNHYYDYPTGPGRIHKAILSWSIHLASKLKTNASGDEIAKIIGILSHYASDIHNPLHCTTNFDPPNAHFSHGDIDGWFRKSDLDALYLKPVHPVMISNIYNYTFETIKTNYAMAETLLIPAMYNNDVSTISEVVENQTNKAIKFFVDLVYTAYMNSNASNVMSLMNPQDISLIDTTIYPMNPVDQEEFYLLLVAGIPILFIIYIIIKKKKAS